MSEHRASDLSTKRLVFLGAGGHARVLLDLAKRCGAKEVVLLDDDPQTQDDAPLLGAPVLTGLDRMNDYDPAETLLVNAIGSAGLPTTRQHIYERGKQAGFTFATLVYPSAIIASHVKLEEGSQILAGAILGPGTTIGENTIVNTRASIDHDCLIARHTHIAPGATLCGSVIVAPGCHIGCGATIVQGTFIGDRALVAAGAVVTKDVEPGTRVAGVPAKPMPASS